MKKKNVKLKLGKQVIAQLSTNNVNSIKGGSGTCTGTCESHRCTAALGGIVGGLTHTVSGYTYEYPRY